MSKEILVRQAVAADAPEAARLAGLLWSPSEERVAEFEELIVSEDAAVFLAEANGRTVGFAQCGLRRDYVEGMEGDGPVGYLEGIYVEPEYRRLGAAQRLVGQCENWARTKGCGEFASDTELGNEEGLRFHLDSGFEEAGRIICFIKRL